MHIFFIVILVLASIVGVTFIVERGLALRWKKVIPPAIEAATEACRSSKDLPMLIHVCQQNPSPLSRLLLTANDHLHWSIEENVDALEMRARNEVVGLERGLVILEIVAGIGPLLGLVGTVYGLIMLFGGMGKSGIESSGAGAADSAILASGIAVALTATLLGLLTAIPSLVAWSLYNKRVETLTVRMETICEEFLQRHYRGGKQT
jgi:biopolymer transport protein ExbB